MNFDLKYPDAIAQRLAAYHEPYKNLEIEVEPGVTYCGRFSPCFICKKRTQFVEYSDASVVHICSDECLVASQIQELECKNERPLLSTPEIAGLPSVL